ncbi:MAG TPA: tRNA uridine-5-carboxymethylaminomethyl(34) synthesis GTPase MnmE [Steroidobacteraceae bacterium]|nr:tRNA uridine-5-carboxymethylaminomethyl(34) synthesis GTPase MnmE [Steroidobacteraceae bacterium]
MEHQPTHGDGAVAAEALSARAPLPHTIIAAATAPGRGGVAIVRLSGPAVADMLAALLGAAAASRVRAAPRQAVGSHFLDCRGEPLDAGLAIFFPAPHSYTGEHVLELHAHGGPILVEALIARGVELGARRAQAGEFTERAYLNGKLDLAQAEAVASLIDACSTAAARAALRSLEGEFSRQVLALAERIGELRAWIEASIDFAEEEIDFLADPELERRLLALEQALEALQSASRQGRVLTEGLTVVIAGPPNAGKSTLLNRLAGHEAAIVAAEPGTTRDLLRERILLDGLPLTLLDTAGLREGAVAASAGERVEPVEREGMRRAREAMGRADHILFVIDGAADPHAAAWRAEQDSLPAGVPVTLLLNKSDQCELPRSAATARTPDCQGTAGVLRISARTGAGLEALSAHLKQAAGLTQADGGVVSARARHVEALNRVAAHVAQARRLLTVRRAGELVAEELRIAQQALGEIVGEEGSEALLGRIFSTFCIGK